MLVHRGPNTAAAAVLVILTWAVFAARPTEAARILAVDMISARSHWNFMSAVLRALTDAGHHVTVFTPFPEGDRENYVEVDTSAGSPVRVDRSIPDMAAEYGGPFATVGRMTAFSRQCCDKVHADGRLAEMAARAGRNDSDGDGGGGGDGTFDAIVVEPTSGGVDCVSSLAEAFRSPVVIYAIATPMLTDAERAFTGHASNPATVAHVFARHGVPRTFARRLANAALCAYAALRVGLDPWALRIADPRPYDYAAAAVRPEVVFVNSHRVTEAPKPVPPNVVDVGGIHLRSPPRPIPEDILDFIEDSPHGVIYFTFGSTIRLSSMPKHIEDVFKRALTNVSQRVLWKYETVMDDMPDNVMIRKWFPQREILLHPKVKLFISHGGISGVYEAVDASVPVLGFPLFFDQIRNIEHLVDADMAISLNLFDVSYDMLFNAIMELIYNKKYKNNAEIASDRSRDRPMSPDELVVYWTEYAIRHRGAPHFKSHAFSLTWYEYLQLDVIVAILVCVLLALFYIYKVFKIVTDFFAYDSSHNKVK